MVEKDQYVRKGLSKWSFLMFSNNFSKVSLKIFKLAWRAVLGRYM